MKIDQSLLAVILLPRSILLPNSAKTVILAKKICRNGTLVKQMNSSTLLLKIKCLGFMLLPK